MSSSHARLPPLILRLSCELSQPELMINSALSRNARALGYAADRGMLNMALLSEAPANLSQRVTVPVQAWYFATEVPCQLPCVQTAISNSNAEAFLNERELKLDSALPRDHPLAPLKPSLQIDIRKPVQSEFGGPQHLEHVVTMHLPYIELLKQLFENGRYSCAVTTCEDANKWILEVGVASSCGDPRTIHGAVGTVFSTADLMTTPADVYNAKEALRSCLDTVMAYEISMENRIGRLETVQEMTTAVSDSRCLRTAACSNVLSSLMDTGAEAEIPLQWSRFLGDVKNGDPVFMDPQQIECMIKGSILGGLQPQLMVFTLNACATVAVQIAQKYGVHYDDIQGIDTAVAAYIKSTSALDLRKMVLEQVRDEMIGNARYTGDPSWKPEYSVSMMPNNSGVKRGDMLAKVDVKMVKGQEAGEDQSIPGFTVAHLLMKEMNNIGGGTGGQAMQTQASTKERTLKFHFDCEDSAAFLAATANSWNIPEEHMRTSVASICKLMPPSVTELQPTLTNMMLVLRERAIPYSTEKSSVVDLQAMNGARLLQNIHEAKQKIGEHKISTTALLAKAPSIGSSQSLGNSMQTNANTVFENFGAGDFTNWWRSQPLNGHAIVTSGNVKHVMTINTGSRAVHIKMLGDDLHIFEGTGPAYQVPDPNSQAVSINLDKQPSTDMRRDLQSKLKNAKLNLSMANNVKSSLHVNELQNNLIFKQVQKTLQQNMRQGSQQNAQITTPMLSTQLAARQTFSLNCAATSASQRMVATDNTFYVTMLCRGSEGIAYTVDTSKMPTSGDSKVPIFFGGSLVNGLVNESETIFIHSEMDADEERRCTTLGALTGVTMLTPETLILNLPTITSRQLRQQMRVFPQTNTVVPLTSNEVSIANSYSCGILTQRNERVDEQELLQSIVHLANEATEVIGCTPVVSCNGFSSSFCLRYP